MNSRPGWVGHRVGGIPGRNGTWTHPHVQGLEVRRVGHPTAIRPYYISGPNAPQAAQTFRLLVTAQLEAERMAGLVE